MKKKKKRMKINSTVPEIPFLESLGMRTLHFAPLMKSRENDTV